MPVDFFKRYSDKKKASRLQGEWICASFTVGKSDDSWKSNKFALWYNLILPGCVVVKWLLLIMKQ